MSWKFIYERRCFYWFSPVPETLCPYFALELWEICSTLGSVFAPVNATPNTIHVSHVYYLLGWASTFLLLAAKRIGPLLHSSFCLKIWETGSLRHATCQSGLVPFGSQNYPGDLWTLVCIRILMSIRWRQQRNLRE